MVNARPAIDIIEGGGVTSAAGFRASGVHAGFRRNPHRRDLALVMPDEPCTVAAVFTQNPFASAPVKVSRTHSAAGVAAALVVNSGNANAATGEEGERVAAWTCDYTASCCSCNPQQVIIASTGVVGVQLPTTPFDTGIPHAYTALSRDGGNDAAQAIMTTDTHPKEYAVSYVSQAEGHVGTTITVGGMCKGSGMIMPNMATMIAVITTDAPLDHATAQGALKQVVDDSFNKVTVDGDSSTNDTCILLASGKGPLIEEGSPAYDEFVFVLTHVCQTLARMIAGDGEGSTKLVTINVTGAISDAEADRAARHVANSPLVKTAIFGHDCNWGRVAVARGTSGARFDADHVSITFMGLSGCRGGLAQECDEQEALRRFNEPEIVIDCDLGEGEGAATVWTCDLTYDYVRINGEYRT